MTGLLIHNACPDAHIEFIELWNVGGFSALNFAPPVVMRHGRLGWAFVEGIAVTGRS